MNTDQIKGKLQDAIGHIKQAAGEATGNDRVANEGLADQVKGSTRETWGKREGCRQHQHGDFRRCGC